MSGKTKKYYKYGDSGLSQAKLVYMIKWLDHENSAIKYEGPFLEEEDAKRTLSDFLKKGLCSWIIRYDD